jgi:hypothetical protein
MSASSSDNHGTGVQLLNSFKDKYDKDLAQLHTAFCLLMTLNANLMSQVQGTEDTLVETIVDRDCCLA